MKNNIFLTYFHIYSRVQSSLYATKLRKQRFEKGTKTMAYTKTAATALVLAMSFNNAAEAALRSLNLAWTASTGTVCKYEVLSQRAPGVMGGTGTVYKPVSGSQTTATISYDDAYVTSVVVRAAGAPSGKTCANTTTYVYSGYSNTVRAGGAVNAFKALNPYDTDRDGLPDNMEMPGGPDTIGGKIYYHTYTDPNKAQTTTACPTATDLELYYAAESIRPNSWVNITNPYKNGLNDPTNPIFKAACDIVTRSKSVPAP